MAGEDSHAAAGAEQPQQQPLGPVLEGSAASTSTTASEAAEAEATTVAPTSGGGKATEANVEALVAEMGRLSRRLREEHGLGCAVWGKDGGVVAAAAAAGDGDGVRAGGPEGADCGGVVVVVARERGGEWGRWGWYGGGGGCADIGGVGGGVGRARAGGRGAQDRGRRRPIPARVVG